MRGTMTGDTMTATGGGTAMRHDDGNAWHDDGNG
jgi:hypothetical protein